MRATGLSSGSEPWIGEIVEPARQMQRLRPVCCAADDMDGNILKETLMNQSGKEPSDAN
jgi:hypothetical protein